MPTITFKNAQLLFDGVELTGALHDVMMESTAEMLDATVFGLNSRTKKAGLYMDKISGKGFFDGVVGVESALFGEIGFEPTIILFIPDGVIEGSITTGIGYVMKGVVAEMNMGGNVGTLLDISFSADNNGTDS